MSFAGRILILDDDPLVGRMMERLLAPAGYVVRCASRAEQAIKLAAEDRPDLALLDVELHEELNGIDVAQQLVERQAVPVIFITSFDDPDLAAATALCQPRGYLIKPVTASQLRAAVAAVLGSGESDGEACAGEAATGERTQLLDELARHGLGGTRGLVALLRAQGHDVERVARSLSLSPNSVRAYDQAARRALGVARLSEWLSNHPRGV